MLRVLEGEPIELRFKRNLFDWEVDLAEFMLHLNLMFVAS